jgi:hypothetical protein
MYNLDVRKVARQSRIWRILHSVAFRAPGSVVLCRRVPAAWTEYLAAVALEKRMSSPFVAVAEHAVAGLAGRAGQQPLPGDV